MAERERHWGMAFLSTITFGLLGGRDAETERAKQDAIFEQSIAELNAANQDGRTMLFNSLSLEERIYHAGQMGMLTRYAGEMEEYARLAGFDEVIPFERRGVQGMIVVEDRQAFVVFAGTNEFRDILRHGRVFERQRPIYQNEATGEAEGAALQRGNYNAAFGHRPWDSSLASMIDRRLTRLEREGSIDAVHFIGFSDGGNMATLIGTDMQVRYERGEFPMEVSGVYAFDAPASGNDAYARFVEQTLGKRLVRIEPEDNMVNALWRLQEDWTPERIEAPEGTVVQVDTKVHSLYRMVEAMEVPASSAYETRMAAAQGQAEAIRRTLATVIEDACVNPVLNTITPGCIPAQQHEANLHYALG